MVQRGWVSASGRQVCGHQLSDDELSVQAEPAGHVTVHTPGGRLHGPYSCLPVRPHRLHQAPVSHPTPRRRSGGDGCGLDCHSFVGVVFISMLQFVGVHSVCS